MRIVIDSNKLQSDELEEFLKRNSSNRAVLTDFVAMEAYKGNTLVGIFKSLEIISKFPNQIVILKNSVSACRLSGRRKSLQKRLIDQNQTNSFSIFIEHLIRAKNGNMGIAQELIEKGRMADEHFSEMLNVAQEMKPAIEVLGKEFTKKERRIIRENDAYTHEMATKLISTILEISSFIAADSPYVRKMPPQNELPNTFFFRFALACYFMIIRRSSEGGVLDTAPEKLRNDFVDMGIVAYGTFFDGVLSADNRLLTVFNDSCIFLYSINAEVPFMNSRITVAENHA